MCSGGLNFYHHKVLNYHRMENTGGSLLIGRQTSKLSFDPSNKVEQLLNGILYRCALFEYHGAVTSKGNKY